MASEKIDEQSSKRSEKGIISCHTGEKLDDQPQDKYKIIITGCSAGEIKDSGVFNTKDEKWEKEE